ncbi:hypothetical protein HK098_006146 [Nowakowskiella sp. JEL0407]|nr:hypothetical protein HK098_006146 [Nowakowskiella sp. JEL0407]
MEVSSPRSPDSSLKSPRSRSSKRLVSETAVYIIEEIVYEGHPDFELYLPKTAAAAEPTSSKHNVSAKISKNSLRGVTDEDGVYEESVSFEDLKKFGMGIDYKDEVHTSSRSLKNDIVKIDSKQTKKRSKRIPPTLQTEKQEVVNEQPRSVTSAPMYVTYDTVPYETEEKHTSLERPKGFLNLKRLISGSQDKKVRIESDDNAENTYSFFVLKLSREELEVKMIDMKRKNAEILRKKEEVDADRREWEKSETERAQKFEEEYQRRRSRRGNKRIQEFLAKEREEILAREDKEYGVRDWDQPKSHGRRTWGVENSAEIRRLERNERETEQSRSPGRVSWGNETYRASSSSRSVNYSQSRRNNSEYPKEYKDRKSPVALTDAEQNMHLRRSDSMTSIRSDMSDYTSKKNSQRSDSRGRPRGGNNSRGRRSKNWEGETLKQVEKRDSKAALNDRWE